MTSINMFIKKASIVATMDEAQHEYRDCDILIEGPQIKVLGLDLVAPSGARIIDGRGKLVLPGFVNTHHHMFQVFTRDLESNLYATSLFDWLIKMYRIWHEVDADMVYTSALVELGMLAKTGCTLISDNHYLFPDKVSHELIDAQIQAAREVGVRFHPTRGSLTPGIGEGSLVPRNIAQSDDEILRDYERLVTAYHDPSDYSMLRIGLGPTNPVTSSENLMRETIRFAREHGLHCHTHLSESPEEEAWSLETHGMREFDYVESLDWVGPDVWYAHCLYVTEEEIRRMGEYHCGVATNPVCNSRFSGKIAPIFKMIDAGVRVGLGVDGIGGFSDMLAEIQTAAVLHMYLEFMQVSPDKPPSDMARKMLKIATRGGASVLGWDKAGSIEPGQAADLTMFDIERLDFAGCVTDPLAALVLYASNHFADMTIVNGKVIVENGVLVDIDEGALIRRANELAHAYLKRIPAV